MIETLDGGDFVLIQTEDEDGIFYDIELEGGLFTSVYLSHFGGNVEASTTGNEKQGELREDWFGNQLFKNEPVLQMNSSLERALNELEITSGNLLRISDYSVSDLSWMLEAAIASKVESEAFITGIDRVEVRDTIQQPSSNTNFNPSWDFEKQRTITE